MTATEREKMVAQLTQPFVVTLAKQVVFAARGDTRSAYRKACFCLRSAVGDGDPMADQWYSVCLFLLSKMPEVAALRQALVTLSPVFH